MRLLADLLVQTLTGSAPGRRDNRFYLTAGLVRELARIPRLLVVDEAQRLPEECIELLRYLHDHDDTAFGLLYVGGNGCWEVLSRQPMLRSRIWRRQSFAPMDRAEVPPVMRSYHRLYAEVDDELLHYVDDHFAHVTDVELHPDVKFSLGITQYRYPPEDSADPACPDP